MEANLPVVDTHSGLRRYIKQSREFPMLAPDVEQELGYRWRDRHDTSAAHQLVNSHLRLVFKIARGYRGYGLPEEDLVGEGQLGLMRAVCRFDPDRGARFASYAVWWIHAEIREYVLRNWSLVKLGTTAAQKKLFFGLRRARRQLQILGDGALAPEHVGRISQMLRVPEQDVIVMDGRLAGRDFSLNAPSGEDGESEWQTYLADDKDTQESLMEDHQQAERRKSLLNSALRRLTTRERDIVVARHLTESRKTLAILSRHYGLSEERVRQIEQRAIKKLQRTVASAA